MNENDKYPIQGMALLLMDHIFKDWSRLLPLIDKPALVIGGSESSIPPESQLYNASLMPMGEAVIMFYEEPGRFNSLI